MFFISISLDVSQQEGIELAVSPSLDDIYLHPIKRPDSVAAG